MKINELINEMAIPSEFHQSIKNRDVTNPRHGSYSPSQMMNNITANSTVMTVFGEPIEPDNVLFNMHEKDTFDDIKNACKNLDISTSQCIARIMVWGGSARNIGRANAEFDPRALAVIDNIRRNPDIDRKEAFRQIQNLHKSNMIPRINIAFYTKLVAFFTADRGIGKQGYILDQFIGRAIAILRLANENSPNPKEHYPLLPVNDEGVPSSNTTPEEYETYCRTIETKVRRDIRRITGKTVTPEQAEFVIFVDIGHSPSPLTKNKTKQPKQVSQPKQQIQPVDPLKDQDVINYISKLDGFKQSVFKKLIKDRNLSLDAIKRKMARTPPEDFNSMSF